MDELVAKSKQSLEKQSLVNDRQKKQSDQNKKNSLTPKKFVGYDAEQGSVELESADGGKALLTGQGTLSNRAIQSGKTVMSYNWQKPDWKPVRSDVDASATPAENQDGPSDDDQDDGDDDQDDGDDNPDDVPSGTPPLESTAPYCQCQIFWVRGIPKDPPASDGDSCPFLGGQSVGILYSAIYSTEFIGFTGGSPIPSAQNAMLTGLLGPISGVRNNVVEGDVVRAYLDHAGGQSLLDSIGGASGGAQMYVTSMVIFRTDGQPDTGGNLPGCLPVEMPDVEPGQWMQVKSCNPPIFFQINENDDQAIVTVWDTATSQEDPLKNLSFESANLEYEVRCEEEGPP